jgi:hypothetical protein
MNFLVGRPILAAADFQSAWLPGRAALKAGCRLIARPTEEAA